MTTTPRTATDQLWTDSSDTLHEIYTAQVFIGDAWLGDFRFDSGRADLRWQRCSYAYFCPECGEVWARLVMSNSRGGQQTFGALHVSCERHAELGQVPGSLLAWHLENLLGDLPPAVVRRELQVHLNYALKGMK